MADVTLKIISVCSSGGHIQVQITVDGVKKKEVTIMRSQLINPLNDVDIEDALAIILRNHIKEAGLTTAASIKTYIEGHIFKW
jgi:hypothetical protein